MEYYMDEKWKLSRDDPNNHSYSSSKSYLTTSKLQKHSNTKSPLVRSFSQKNPSSSSQKGSPSKSSFSRSSSQRCADFTRKCGSVAKEQRAKFYIVKRCITMLLRRNKNGDS